MFSEKEIKEISNEATGANIEPAALLAIAEVESGGTIFYKINGRYEPPIRFEGHYFDRLLPIEERRFARSKGLSSNLAGGVKNPASQEARWKLLEQAAAINREAAYKSVSWGIGQVMGENWEHLGYPNVDALVEEARSSLAGQVRIMIRFILWKALRSALRRHDWKRFAYCYNGPSYAENHYTTKLKQAYARYVTLLAGMRPLNSPKPALDVDKTVTHH
ncbi:N-acetylmuramidase family protein [Phyllobacterium sp. 628]|uniref:N-acetylmuramidase family protein n=1 Tax=Phyllobacterium sp. 628 TaxID=2718938 RepID=UPI00166262D4|nr:N-acetylmuramidase family protein [Phyllobacterium sp. 628]QND53958.1 N-acetylmuramidase family protein [Phyllobacterium sp. 628]